MMLQVTAPLDGMMMVRVGLTIDCGGIIAPTTGETFLDVAEEG